MLMFAQPVFDDSISGTSLTWYTAAEQNGALGACDQLAFQVITGNVSGTSPTLTVRVQVSGDNQNWVNAAGTAEINAQALAASSNGNYYISKLVSNVLMGHVRLAITLGGTNPQTRLKIYAAGRSA
jgi:hypothetical protein